MPLLQAEATRSIAVIGLIITLDPLPQNVLPGDLVEFTGRVMSNGAGVEGADVHIWHNASGTDIASALSGANGYFTVPWIVQWIVGSGPWETTMPCSSHDFYAWTVGAEQSNFESMTVAYRTRIHNLTAPDTIQPGINFFVIGNLQYESGYGSWIGLAGKRVNITYNGTAFGSDYSTDADGRFEVLSHIPNTGTYTLTATFAGAASLGQAARALRLTTQEALIPIAASTALGLLLLYLSR